MTDYKTCEPDTLADSIAEATTCISSLYPLTSFIACNALKGFEEIPFAAAMRKSSDLFGSRGFLPLADYRAMYESGRIEPRHLEEAFQRIDSRATELKECEGSVRTVAEMFDVLNGFHLVEVINKEMVKWCAAYLDRTQAQWSVRPKDSFYGFWRELASYDLSLMRHGVQDWASTIKSMPERSEDALHNILRDFELRGEQVAPYFRRHIVQMPGYASYLKWMETENIEPGILQDYLAIRLHYEQTLSRVISKRLYKCSDLGLVKPLLESEVSNNRYNPAVDDYSAVWQEAYELTYRDELLSSLPKELPAEERASCQIVFCIDVRSEPIRRAVELAGPYATYGFAGFFGIPMKLTELGSVMTVDVCPVLLKPEKLVKETASEGARKISWQALKVSALQVKKRLKCNLAGAFGLVELLGLFSAVPLALKTFLPAQSRKLWNYIETRLAGNPATKLDLSAFSVQEKIALAEGVVRGIGLTEFGKLVVLCGHKSSSQNNPFASALDCGACGGNGGGYSARLAVHVLNDTEVRSKLELRGIEIPETTLFIAAEHDTTTDQFEFFDCDTIGSEHAESLHKLKADLLMAGASARVQRALKLPEGSLEQLNGPLERSCDWAQIAPEWGLAGNAAFIAAPRALSKGVDLQGRVFLHSYEYSTDRDVKVLELIMTAPLVVAQWINMQYYLSAVDNETFGSGSKVVHNVVGDFGVMQGASSDLRIGLPLQSLATESRLMHEPMRLLAVIRAPLSAIDRVLEKHSQVRKLVANRWIRLVALDPRTGEFFEADDCSKWRRITLESKGSTNEVMNGLSNAILAKD